MSISSLKPPPTLINPLMDQLLGDAFKGLIKRQESDRCIVLGDGRAVHMGKAPAGRLTEQSTHAWGRNVPAKVVSRSLLKLTEEGATEPLPLRDRSEEPCARKPHAGICEGAVGQPAVLP